MPSDIAGRIEAAYAHFRARRTDAGNQAVRSLLKEAFELSQEGRLAEALHVYNALDQAFPGQDLIRTYRAMVLLLTGNFVEGWEMWEHRPEGTKSRGGKLPVPLWDGGPLDGGTILVTAEQGLGDTIQFARYAPLIAERGGRVVLGVSKSLRGLMADVDGVADVLVTGDPRPPAVAHIPLMSLPWRFGTRLETIPAGGAYLGARPDLVAEWRERLAGDGLKVGLSWHGGADNIHGRNKSLPLDTLAAPLPREGVRYFSLQVGTGAEEREACSLPIEDLGVDLDNTAAIIDSLDLVISVDTSIAHLAGALGKPVWTLLQFVPDWRWMVGRADSPWYPTMRLFRQHRRGDWPGVAEAVAEALGAVL